MPVKPAFGPGSSRLRRPLELKPGAPIKISLGWPELMTPTRLTEDPARSPALAPVKLDRGERRGDTGQGDRAGEEIGRGAGGTVEDVNVALVGHVAAC